MPGTKSWVGDKPVVDLTVLLTVYKRKTLKQQIDALARQTVAPKHIIVYHDEAHRRIPKRWLVKNGFGVTENSYNTKFHGRFASLLNARTEWVTVLDDDIIPGRTCLESYLEQAKALDAIVGGMGRIARTNPARDALAQPVDVGLREKPELVDFVGHMWLMKKATLFDMFSFQPVTWDTGEDMHLCFSSKLRSGTPSYAAAQPTEDSSCDVSMNRYADDEFAAYKTMPKSERERVEEFFTGHGLTFITPEDQARARDETMLVLDTPAGAPQA